MPLADYNDMVEAFPSNRTNDPLRKRFATATDAQLPLPGFPMFRA